MTHTVQKSPASSFFLLVDFIDTSCTKLMSFPCPCIFDLRQKPIFFIQLCLFTLEYYLNLYVLMCFIAHCTLHHCIYSLITVCVLTSVPIYNWTKLEVNHIAREIFPTDGETDEKFLFYAKNSK